MIKPKRNYPRAVHQATKETIVKFCENPKCGAKLSQMKAKKCYKYCDRVCKNEHSEILKRERRPAQVLCTFCSKELDTMRASPSYWAKSELHFCDEICVDGYRRQTGQYQEMSRLGNDKMKEYKDKHGHVHNHEERSMAVSKNNTERPPKAKHFVREGRVWGYDVRFYPNENDDGYRVSVPELSEELGTLYAKTVKEGLRLVRQHILEIRAEEVKGETDAN